MPATDRRRRARAALAAAAVIAVATHLGLGALLEAYPGLRDFDYGHKVTRLHARVAAGPGTRPFTVLMLGSSRGDRAFCAPRVEQDLRQSFGRDFLVFNFSASGAGSFTELLYLQRVLAEGVRPDLLFLEVLPPAFGRRATLLEWGNFAPRRLTRGEVPTAERYGFDRPRAAWWRALVNPCFEFREEFQGRLLTDWVPMDTWHHWKRPTDPSGWRQPGAASPPPEVVARRLRSEAATYGPLLASLESDGPATEALRETLRLCRDRGTAVVLVLMPERSEFRSWYSPEGNARLLALLRGLSREFGAGLVDARDWLPDGCFGDGHHVLLEGAYRFTERLTRETVLPEAGRLLARPAATEGTHATP